MTNRIFKILLLLSFFLFFSCIQKSKFNKTEWNIEGDLKSYPNREKMLFDLTENNKLKGLTYKELVEKVGKPENSTNEINKIFYNIETKYGSDIDPIFVKVLEFKFNKDNLVTDFKITELKN